MAAGTADGMAAVEEGDQKTVDRTVDETTAGEAAQGVNKSGQTVEGAEADATAGRAEEQEGEASAAADGQKEEEKTKEEDGEKKDKPEGETELPEGFVKGDDPNIRYFIFLLVNNVLARTSRFSISHPQKTKSNFFCVTFWSVQPLAKW